MFKVTLVMMLLLFLAGCTTNTGDETDDVTVDLPVSVYFAIEDTFDADGWLHYIKIAIYEDGVVADVVLNGVNRLANSTRADVAQLAGFEDIFAYNFYEQVTLLEESIIGVDKNDVMNVISSFDGLEKEFDATVFAQLIAVALSAGDEAPGPYIDGPHQAFQVVDADGWAYFVNVFILNGHVVAVHYNAIYEDGTLKYNIFDPDTSVIDDDWRRQAQLLEDEFIRLQDPMLFSFCENGFTTDLPGVEIEIESFVNLVTTALAEGPIIQLNE